MEDVWCEILLQITFTVNISPCNNVIGVMALFLLQFYYQDLKPDCGPTLPPATIGGVAWSVAWSQTIICPKASQVRGVNTITLLPSVKSEPPWSQIVNIKHVKHARAARANKKNPTGKCLQPDVMYFSSFKHGDEDKRNSPPSLHTACVTPVPSSPLGFHQYS